MKSQEVWKIISLSKVPPGRQLMKCKWVFKLKRDGTYRSRLIMMGFTQIPDVDFNNSFALVVSDITMRILIVLWIQFNWDTQLVDVEGTFPYSFLEVPNIILVSNIFSNFQIFFWRINKNFLKLQMFFLKF